MSNVVSDAVSNAVSEHDTWFWREVAVAYRRVAADHSQQATVASEAEGLVAVVMWDENIDGVNVSIMAKTGKERTVVTDATDRS